MTDDSKPIWHTGEEDRGVYIDGEIVGLMDTLEMAEEVVEAVNDRDILINRRHRKILDAIRSMPPTFSPDMIAGELTHNQELMNLLRSR